MRPQTAIAADLHCHTVASGHAFNTIDEMIVQARSIGLRLLGVSDHGPNMIGGPTPGYFEMGDRLPRRVGRTTVVFGCEANILDHRGTLDVERPALNMLDYVMAGLHLRTDYPARSSRKENTAAILGTIRGGHVDAITHPFTTAFPVDITAVAKCAADHDVMLEVNCSRLRHVAGKLGDATAREELMAMSRMLQVLEASGGSFIIGSDAHHRSALGCSWKEIRKFSVLLDGDLSKGVNNDVPGLLSRFGLA